MILLKANFVEKSFTDGHFFHFFHFSHPSTDSPHEMFFCFLFRGTGSLSSPISSKTTVFFFRSDVTQGSPGRKMGSFGWAIIYDLENSLKRSSHVITKIFCKI